MSLNDYVKYLTEQITSYMDTPAEEKREQRFKHKDEPPVYSSKWLGVLPLAFKIARRKLN